MIPSQLKLDRSRFKLNRRSFLRGVGTAGLVLPFLESLPDRSAFAAEGTPRFGLFLCTSCGVVGNKFWPSAMGELTTAGMEADGKSTSVLAPYADRL
ncbi:MAG TPA: twin-arginine translocation signal domain-containing protein, partial [Polyangiaceae bacterium]|nr:twin-arginine translocation signal domain-containing protein [Polyangiaceae bacterium]